METEIFDRLYSVAQKIANKNKDLIAKTGFSSVGCAIMGASGKIYTGLNVGWFHSSCAEVIALSNAWQAGERELKYVTAVKFNKQTNELESVTPCGICRQMFKQLQPEIKIIYMENGVWEEKSVKQLLTDAY